MDKKNKKTPIANYGEFGLIDRLTKNIKIGNKSTKKGVGDDAAVINYGEKDTVLTTDLLLEGIHFDLMYTPLKHLGYKAVIVNLSDVCAMNAQARQIVVSIGISSRFSVEDIDALYEGIYLACEKYNVDLVGGDTSSSLTGLTISITAIGEASSSDIVYRNTAQEHDLICVSGNLGAAYMGLQLLEREKEVFKTNPNSQPDLSKYEYLLQRQLKPEARKDINQLLKEHKIKPTAMIDVSDGLSSELLHICTKSDVGCAIYEEKIPIDAETAEAANEMNIEPIISALNGGEDYELLFTVPLEYHKQIENLKKIKIIGHITNKNDGLIMFGKGGNEMPIKAQGWNSFEEN